MRRVSFCGVVLALTIFALPREAAAGGSEFPADGARNLGRGATGFTRADDPHLMLRNPALLADLWDDVAMAGAHFLFVDSCFHATGGYGWNVGSLPDVSDFGDGPIYLQDPKNGYADEPYPEVCYSGPMPILPSIALTKKLAPNFGAGIGFFPPDTAALNQWGDPDGTIDTPNGRRPNPVRYFKSHLNTSFLTALGAVGYRPVDWLRVGLGFQWTLVVFNSTTWSRPSRDLAPHADVRTDTQGKDFFIPGIIASVQVVPSDNLDFALGFKWSDRVKASSKLDITTGAFGTGEPFTDSSGNVLPGGVPTTARNQPGLVDAPPVWVPQLSFGARYADRLVPRVQTKDWDSAHEHSLTDVQDHMATERWDIELEAVVYFNSVTDVQTYSNDAKNAAMIELVDVRADGTYARLPAHVGECTRDDGAGRCVGRWQTPLVFGGKDQISLRLGGDYNIIPDFFTVRAGVSHETNGIYTEYLNVTNYMMGRTGIHAGATLRVADKTDISVAFAHFIQPSVRLQVNPKSALPRRYYLNAQGEYDSALARKYNYVAGKHDGTAKFEVPYGDDFGPNFANAGSYNYSLDVLSVSLAQHF